MRDGQPLRPGVHPVVALASGSVLLRRLGERLDASEDCLTIDRYRSALSTGCVHASGGWVRVLVTCLGGFQKTVALTCYG
jgi:hypothetical protein